MNKSFLFYIENSCMEKINKINERDYLGHQLFVKKEYARRRVYKELLCFSVLFLTLSGRHMGIRYLFSIYAR